MIKWYYHLNEESSKWHHTEDKFRKNFSITVLEINNFKAKRNELLRCFKFCATVRFVKWYSIKINSELPNNARKIISYTA